MLSSTFHHLGLWDVVKYQDFSGLLATLSGMVSHLFPLSDQEPGQDLAFKLKTCEAGAWMPFYRSQKRLFWF